MSLRFDDLTTWVYFFDVPLVRLLDVSWDCSNGGCGPYNFNRYTISSDGIYFSLDLSSSDCSNKILVVVTEPQYPYNVGMSIWDRGTGQYIHVKVGSIL